MKIRFPRVTIGGAVLALVVGLMSSFAAPAAAVDGSGFDPGNIISDANFFNGSAMDANSVQAFLNAQVPTCRSGYTCLKDYRQDTWSRAADPMCNAYSGAAGESAAQIIARVGIVCNVSQKVLLVLLQKEQSLVSDTWPGAGQYRSATGFGCPDTAPCDAEFYGFYNQVYKAAWQYKRYTNPPGTSAFFTWFPVGHVSNVLYNPNGGCGSAPVVIRNQATAALYYYTPYQPNAAALANMYGEGDACSAYGNRNFWRLYSDWFGSPTGATTNPIGNVEVIQARPGVFHVTGWALDPDTSESIAVHVYVGTVGHSVAADKSRPDVAAAYGLGANHGIDVTVPAEGAGASNVCVYGMNVGAGANVLLGCQSIASMSGSPAGNLEAVTVGAGGVTVSGWALDPDTVDPVAVHIYVDAVGKAFVANGARADVGAAYPLYGVNHGFSQLVSAGAGSHQVCAYAINTGAGGNVQLGCKTVDVPAA
ncbi:MAG: hypothetical protein ABI255_04285 [Microbacteriaceae bacterium]